MTTFRLITNLSVVILTKPARVWLEAKALLLEYPLGMNVERRKTGRLRGFYTDAALPISSLDLRGDPFDYTMTEARSPHTFIGNDGVAKPLVTGYLMDFPEGVQLSLGLAVPERGIRCRDYDGDSPLLPVWEDLRRDVLDFWTAPAIAVSVYVPKEHAPELW